MLKTIELDAPSGRKPVPNRDLSTEKKERSCKIDLDGSETDTSHYFMWVKKNKNKNTGIHEPAENHN